ncbi:Pleckstrin-likey domain-containing family A member 7 [Varanus komodoensis]|nr:Pleckstrin-likey domain-containing family A member 7 [Varanus komodoensis]
MALQCQGLWAGVAKQSFHHQMVPEVIPSTPRDEHRYDTHHTSQSTTDTTWNQDSNTRQYQLNRINFARAELPTQGKASCQNSPLLSALGYLGTMSERDRPKSGLSQASSTVTISSVAMGTKPHSVRPVQKVHTFGKRANSIKRDPNSPVIMRGWLYKKDSSGLKLWKRRWFVLSNYCLFYYRDSREEMVLGSIPLPSYEIRTAFSKEKKNRRFVFKAEHPGMRTYYFSADTQLDMNSWIRAMNQSAVAEGDYGSWGRRTRDLDTVQSFFLPCLNSRGPHGHSVSTHTSFEDVTLTQDHRARSTESLEIARLSEAREPEASSSESLHLQDSQKGSPCPRRTSLSSSFDGGFHRERIDQPDLR